MEKKYIQEVNATTGEEIVREFTAEEYAQAETDLAIFEAVEAERLANAELEAAAKSSAIAKLEAVGLTADEIAALTK